jgi:predicted dehydrogenase/nucleoside-diphosphate-sugar epimerase
MLKETEQELIIASTGATFGNICDNKTKVAIIGCGAVSECRYIPIVSSLDTVESIILVDKNLSRTQTLADKFLIPKITDDYKQVIGKVDAAILALPHHLHAPVAIDLLNHGLHVLVEKPMALTNAECQMMISAAKQNNVVLAVGQTRRFLRSHQFVKRLISGDFLGKIYSFDMQEGAIYNWPATSDFFFRRETGGGVLADTGAHTLDTLLWWLGDYESFDYFDDSMGGVEANCKICLKMQNGSHGTVELSRTRTLRNSFIIRGERATLEVQPLGSQVSIQLNDTKCRFSGNVVDERHTKATEDCSVYDLMKNQVEDWIEAIQNKYHPCVAGEDAQKSVALIEACYKNRKPLELPWPSPIPVIKNVGTKIRGKKVLVTGGTGFIGSRLVECLSGCGADIRVLVRNLATVPPIARFPIKIVQGEITDLTAVKKAAEGCDIIFHCAYGNTGSPSEQKAVTIRGTENILKAALEYNVKRIVHVSTVSVYGRTKNGQIDESAQRRYSKNPYADSKLKAEKLAFYYFKKYGLGVSIVQPTIVYGPSGRTWTVGLVNQLKNGRVIMIEDGSGLCNAVYVDDVVSAILLAATKEEAVGEAFLISAEKPVTWRQFYGAYENMLGVESLVSMSLKEVKAFNKRYKKDHRTIRQITAALREHPSILKWVLQLPAVNRLHQSPIVPPTILNYFKKVFKQNNNKVNSHHDYDAKPILPLSQNQIGFFQARARVKIDKAKHLLGYQPNFDLKQGMELTERWLRFANLI